MGKVQVNLRLDEDKIAALDARAARDGRSRTELVEFALEPLVASELGQLRPLILPPATLAMLDRIAAGQKVHRVDVMRRALVDYAARAAFRWQVNARQPDRPGLKLIQDQIDTEAGEEPAELAEDALQPPAS